MGGVLKRYRIFRESIRDILNFLKNEILESYEVEWDDMDYEGEIISSSLSGRE